LIEEVGGELKDWGVIGDDRAQLSQAIGAALEWADVVLLSGGSSMGAKDIALETILSFPDAKFVFHGISVAPASRRFSPRRAASRFWDCPATLFPRSSSSICSARRVKALGRRRA
jgi:molybdopterin biosynthesis enzyme